MYVSVRVSGTVLLPSPPRLITDPRLPDPSFPPQGLETTAKYDPASQTFVIHSPTLTAMKFWPGGLGKTATHAIIMARLLLQGKDLGMHSFIVPLRNRVDHQPLSGVALGDIGPKLGFNSVDNGFCICEFRAVLC